MPATRKAKTEEQQNNQELNNEKLLEIISILQNQVKDLKDQLDNKNTNQVSYVGVSKMDKPCTLIHLIECHPSLPTTIKVNGNEIRFSRFGEKRTFRFAEMQDITSRYREWFERGVFTLGEDCQEFENDFGIQIMNMPMPKEKHRQIAVLPIAEFKSIVNSLTETQALLLAKTWVDRYNSGATGYTNFEKIKILNKKTKGFMKEFMADLIDED